MLSRSLILSDQPEIHFSSDFVNDLLDQPPIIVRPRFEIGYTITAGSPSKILSNSSLPGNNSVFTKDINLCS